MMAMKEYAMMQYLLARRTQAADANMSVLEKFYSYKNDGNSPWKVMSL